MREFNMNEDQGRTALVRSGLLAEDSELTWADKFSLIEIELRKNPARSDGLIASTIGVVSKASVYRVREVLVADGKIENIPLAKRLSRQGVFGRGNRSSDHCNGNGNRIKTVEGKTVVDICREAIQIEESGSIAEDAARVIGIGVQTYRQAKAIILLSDRSDLSEIEAAMVRTSIAEMNETRRTRRAYERIKEIANRLFGVKTRVTTKAIERTIERRNERFQNTMAVLVEKCRSVAEIPIPNLSDEEIIHAVKQIEEARSGIKQLKERIQSRRWR